jgi:glycosyltransferase involved in cell wall biosynthesis
VEPAVTGNGLAMRAGAVLRALAARHRVWLVIVPYFPSPAGALPDGLRALCEGVASVPPDALAPPVRGVLPRLARWYLARARRQAGAADADAASAATVWRDGEPLPFSALPFDVLHAFRLATVPAVRRYADAIASRGPTGRAPALHLDLDDVESEVHAQLARLYRRDGRDVLAQLEERAAARAREHEDDVLARFDRVYVCSEADRERLRPRARAELRVLPNSVAIPDAPPAPSGGAFTFLFVGTLGYHPNADAILHFCAEVLPLLRARAPGAFGVTIVGGGAPPAVRALGELPDVRLTGAVADVAPYYREADAVIVPIRAGGGTRIKALEAFSYRRPVVATSVGVAGIDARHEQHVLVADTPDAFADCCLRLLRDPGLGRRLASSALSLVTRAHTSDAVASSLAASPPPHPPGARSGAAWPTPA